MCFVVFLRLVLVNSVVSYIAFNVASKTNWTVTAVHIYASILEFLSIVLL